MAEGTIGNPQIVEEEVDILIIGGGMAACGTAFEIGRWNESAGLKIKLVDKAALDRRGAGSVRDQGRRHLPPTHHLIPDQASTDISISRPCPPRRAIAGYPPYGEIRAQGAIEPACNI